MAYFTKYIVDFAEFQLLIKVDGYSGSIIPLEAGNPAVTHRWDKDEPTAPIKGSSLTANIIGAPLLDFYSDDDTAFKGELYKASQLLFSGFLVQDDCVEDVDDTTHQVTLSFTDNLGLLKDVSFGDAIAEPSTSSIIVHINSSNFDIETGYPFVVGDRFTILASGTNYGTYTIATVIDPTHYTTVEHLPALSGFFTIALSEVLVDSKISLFAVVQACLRATSLSIPLEIFANLVEDNMGSNGSFFEQILIARESFLKSEREYDNCYAVLESVLTTFNATLIQANGQWNIIRWFEHASSSWKYTSAFARIDVGSYTGFDKISGLDQPLYPEFGYTQKVLRPYQVAKETFNYAFLFNVLKNADLKDLGTLIRQYNVNEEDYKPDEDPDSVNDYVVTYKEYAPTWWTANNIGTPNEIYIRVIEDALHYELERYLVVEKNVTSISDGVAVFAFPIELSKDDIVEISFQFRTSVNNTQPSPSIGFNAALTTGAYTTPSNNQIDIDATPGNFYMLKYTTEWFLASSSSSDVYGSRQPDNVTNRWVGVDVSRWQSVSIRSQRAPVDGMLYLFLSDLAGSTFLASGEETHYKDFTFNILYAINDSTKITGHTHTNTQAIATKNKNEIDIKVDDSPRNSISGTLFSTVIGSAGQHLRTKGWLAGIGTSMRLGELTTGELKQWRSKARTILEGNLHAETSNDIIVSPLNTFTNPAFPNLNFIPGTMEIDYANKVWTGTLYELYATGEAAVTSVYAFDYIYDTK